MLKTTTDFPGGSAGGLRIEEGVIRFHALLGGGPVSMWWHFALHSDRPRTVECVWERTHEVLGSGGLAAAVPVCECGSGWRRVSPRSCHFSPQRQELRFRVPCRQGVTQVAYCFPYGGERLGNLKRELAGTGRATVRTLGHSEHGRPFELIEFGEGPLQVWVTARHHSGEMTGGYVLEGLVREALRQPRLLRAARFHVAPAMDVDGVAEGLYGKDRSPQDFNRDYVSRPTRPEVAALRQAAEAAGRVDLFLDLHGPAPGDCSFLVPTNEAQASAEHWEAVVRLGQWLEALAPARCPVRVADIQRGALNWTAENTLQTSTSYFHGRFGALATTLEVSYHRTWAGQLLRDRDWLALGRALARTLAVQCGVRRAPDVSDGAPPPSLLPRFDHWTCVHLPIAMEMREVEGALRLTGTGGKSSGWMMHTAYLPKGKVAFSYRLSGKVGRVTVTAKGFERRSGLPTGHWVTTPVQLKATGTWQTVGVKSHEAARLMLRVEGLEGTLEVRVEGGGAEL